MKDISKPIVTLPISPNTSGLWTVLLVCRGGRLSGHDRLPAKYSGLVAGLRICMYHCIDQLHLLTKPVVEETCTICRAARDGQRSNYFILPQYSP